MINGKSCLQQSQSKILENDDELRHLTSQKLTPNILRALLFELDPSRDLLEKKDTFDFILQRNARCERFKVL